MSKYVKSKVKINNQAIRNIEKAAEISLHQTAQATLTDLISKEYMPFDNGTLQNENTFVDSSNLNNGVISITSTTPYARRLYFHPEYDFQFINNKNAGGAWFKPYIDGNEKDFIANAFRKLFKRNGGF